MTAPTPPPAETPKPERLFNAMAAVGIVLGKRWCARREILGAVEGVATEPADWWVVVLTRTSDEEWELWGCWPEAEGPRGEYDDAAGGMVVRNLTNALGHGDALLHLVGYATGVLE